MTTSWCLATHGRLVDAVRTHATGTLLALAALVAGLVCVIVAARGKRLTWQPGETAIAAVSMAFVGIVICEWIVRMLAQ